MFICRYLRMPHCTSCAQYTAWSMSFQQWSSLMRNSLYTYSISNTLHQCVLQFILWSTLSYPRIQPSPTPTSDYLRPLGSPGSLNFSPVLDYLVHPRSHLRWLRPLSHLDYMILYGLLHLDLIISLPLSLTYPSLYKCSAQNWWRFLTKGYLQHGTAQHGHPTVTPSVTTTSVWRMAPSGRTNTRMQP